MPQSLAHLLAANWSAPPSIKAFTSFAEAGDFSDHSQQGVAKMHDLAGQFSAQAHWLSQAHGAEVARVAVAEVVQGVVADALCTSVPQQMLFVRTADCVPIFLCSVRADWIAVIHAGWRGIANNIVANTVASYVQNSKYAIASDLLACIAPCISLPHYEVDASFKQCFSKRLPDLYSCFYAGKQDHKYQFDLRQACRIQLQQARVQAISCQPQCTYADNFFSYRRDADQRRQANFIVMSRED